MRRTGGEPEWIADAADPWGMALSSGLLYWADPGNSVQTGVMMRAELDGSSVSQLAAGLAFPGDIALDDEFIYFTSTGESCSVESDGSGAQCIGGGIARLPKAGGSPERLHATSAAGAIALHESSLYWPAMSPPRIMSAPLGGSERTVASVVEGIGDLKSDGRALYWATGERVLRMSFDEERTLRLASDLQGASSVAVRGDWAYVAERTAGRILRVASDGSANRPSGPITGPCPAPIGTTEDLALTPRADENLELLALSLEPGRISASSSVYERVVADVAALRALSPQLADIAFLSPQDGKTLIVRFTDIGAQSIRAGEYSAWDCLHDAYGLTSMTPFDVFDSAYMRIELSGIFDMTLISQLYAQLPGVETAEPDISERYGSTLCAARDGDRYEYVVDEASGDLLEGNGQHHVHLFASTTAGSVTALGDWSSESGEPAPEWFGRICMSH